MVHTTLYWSRHVTLLFDQWSTETWTGYLLALLACFLSALFSQFLKDRRFHLRSKTASDSLPTTSDPLSGPLIVKLRRNGVARVEYAAMFLIRAVVGYLNILAIMSYNGGVFLAIIAGMSVGFYIFLSSVNEEEEENEKISGVEDPSDRA